MQRRLLFLTYFSLLISSCAFYPKVEKNNIEIKKPLQAKASIRVLSASYSNKINESDKSYYYSIDDSDDAKDIRSIFQQSNIFSSINNEYVDYRKGQKGLDVTCEISAHAPSGNIVHLMLPIPIKQERQMVCRLSSAKGLLSTYERNYEYNYMPFFLFAPFGLVQPFTENEKRSIYEILTDQIIRDIEKNPPKESDII